MVQPSRGLVGCEFSLKNSLASDLCDGVRVDCWHAEAAALSAASKQANRLVPRPFRVIHGNSTQDTQQIRDLGVHHGAEARKPDGLLIV